MPNIILPCIALLLSAASFAWSEDAAGTKHEGKGYTIVYPAAWEKQLGFMGTDSLALSPMENAQDTFRENINIVLEDVPAGTTRDDYMAATKVNLSNVFGADCLLNSTETEIGGVPATVLEYTGQMGVMSLHNNAYVIFTPQRAYVITCSTLKGVSRDTFKDQLDSIARTFVIADAAAIAIP